MSIGFSGPDLGLKLAGNIIKSINGKRGGRFHSLNYRECGATERSFTTVRRKISEKRNILFRGEGEVFVGEAIPCRRAKSEVPGEAYTMAQKRITKGKWGEVAFVGESAPDLTNKKNIMTGMKWGMGKKKRLRPSQLEGWDKNNQGDENKTLAKWD